MWLLLSQEILLIWVTPKASIIMPDEFFIVFLFSVHNLPKIRMWNHSKETGLSCTSTFLSKHNCYTYVLLLLNIQFDWFAPLWLLERKGMCVWCHSVLPQSLKIPKFKCSGSQPTLCIMVSGELCKIPVPRPQYPQFWVN